MHRFDRRVRRLETQADEEESPDGQGLAALLAWASRHRPAENDAWEDDEAAASTGLTALLAEARRWLAQRDQDTPR